MFKTKILAFYNMQSGGMMVKEEIPFSEKLIKKYVGDGEIEFTNYMPRSKSGARDLEIKAIYDDGMRKIIVLHDYAVNITGKEVEVRPFNGKDERNAEIYRLYTEENLSQVFLANFFGISQPAVSLIVKDIKNK